MVVVVAAVAVVVVVIVIAGFATFAVHSNCNRSELWQDQL